MIPAGPGWLRADDFGDLELALCVGCAHDGLKLPWLWCAPGIGPDDPGVRRHGWFDSTVVPRAAGVEAEFNFTDAIRSTEGDTAKRVFRAS